MANIENILYKINRYGIYAKPYINYYLENCIDEDVLFYLDVIIKFNDNRYDDMLKGIHENISRVKNKNIYYVILGIKMMTQYNLKEDDYKFIYKKLKRNTEHIPPLAREILKPLFLIIEGKSHYFKKSKFWGKNTLKDDYFKSFYYLGKGINETDKFKKQTYLFKSIGLSKEIPNPTLIQSGFKYLINTYNNYPEIKKHFIDLDLFYSTYYFENPFKLIETMELYIQNNNDLYKYFIKLEMIKRVYLNNKEKIDISKFHFVQISSELKLNKSSYQLTDEIINYLIKIKGSFNYKEMDISRTGFYYLINKKKDKINSKTIRKILDKIEIHDDVPFEFKLEKFKKIIDKKIIKLFYFIQNTDEYKLLLDLISTYISYPKTTYKSRKHYDFIINIKYKSLNYLKNIDYNEKLFLILALRNDESIYVDTLKSLIKNNLSYLDKDKLINLFKFYMSKDKKKRILIEKFLKGLSRFEKLPELLTDNYKVYKKNKYINKRNYKNALYFLNTDERKSFLHILKDIMKIIK